MFLESESRCFFNYFHDGCVPDEALVYISPLILGERPVITLLMPHLQTEDGVGR